MRTRLWLYSLLIGSAAALAACSSSALTPRASQAVPSEAQQYAQLQREIPDALPGEESGFIPFRSANPVRAACDRQSRGVHCMALVRTDLPAETVSPDTFPKKHGFGPAQLRQAYGLTTASTTRGTQQTVAIVDAFGYPNAEADLAVYRKAAGLPACTIKNGCLQILNQSGQSSPLPSTDTGWDIEQALDFDMVSAICPNCKIVLVQSNTSENWNDIYTAADTAATLANVVSNSYGGQDTTYYQAQNPHYAHPGHVFVASAGDSGAAEGPNQPCAFPTVICVGGTRLVKASNTRGWSERVWNDLSILKCGSSGTDSCGATGSGCSQLPKPLWQAQTICKGRVEADVSAIADEFTPVAVYSSAFSTPGWYGVGGTSAAAPIVAGIVALNGNASAVAQPKGVWHAHKATHFFDVISGTNYDASGHPCPVYTNMTVCTAGKGYDGPTGWGTPHGIGGF